MGTFVTFEDCGCCGLGLCSTRWGAWMAMKLLAPVEAQAAIGEGERVHATRPRWGAWKAMKLLAPV